MALDTSYHSGDQPRRLEASYEDYLSWSGENHYVEWVDGILLVYRALTSTHQWTLGFLLTVLHSYVRHRDLGKVTMIPFEMRVLPGRSSRAPDIIFVAKERLHRLTEERCDGPADLVIEILDDNSVQSDRDDKFYEYQEAGVREYWIVDPRRGKWRIDCYRLMPDGKYLPMLPDAEGHYHSLVVPGFWLDPSWLSQGERLNPDAALAMIAPEAFGDRID